MQVIIQHRETADVHREDIRKFLEPILSHSIAVLIALAQQARTANTTRHAGVPASQGHTDQLTRAIVIRYLQRKE